MLEHERVGQLELGLHDLASVPLERGLRHGALAEPLPLDHELGELAPQERARWRSGRPQLHRRTLAPGRAAGHWADGWTRTTSNALSHPFEG